MTEETKQKEYPSFQPGDKVVVTKVRDGLCRQVGDTATVLLFDPNYVDGLSVILVCWDSSGIPKEQRCWADQFEIVTQIKVMEDTTAYLEAINALTQGSSNG